MRTRGRRNSVRTGETGGVDRTLQGHLRNRTGERGKRVARAERGGAQAENKVP